MTLGFDIYLAADILFVTEWCMGVLLYSGMVEVRDSFHDRATFMSRATFLTLVNFVHLSVSGLA